MSLRPQQLDSTQTSMGSIIRAIDRPYSDDLKDGVHTSLEQEWINTKARFYEKTKTHLKDFVTPDKDTLLNQWANRLHIDDLEDREKVQKLAKIVQSIIDCLTDIGPVAAAGASIAWQPAGACVDALMYVLNMPRRIHDVYANVIDLLEEVESFLVRFKILKHLDSRVRLNADLTLKARQMLFCFVDICIMSIDLLEIHKVKTSLKAALLSNDSGTEDELNKFRRLAQGLDSLTSTIAFHHVINIEESQKDTSTTLRSIQEAEKQTFGIIKTIPGLIKESVTVNNDQKTQTVNRERLRNIEERIYAKHDRFRTGESSPLPSYLDDFLPDTLPALHEWEQYNEWKEAATGPKRAALLLTGDVGSGRSCMMGALKEELDNIRRNAQEDEPSTYVALHVFSGYQYGLSDDNDKFKSTSSSIPSALRSMAVQVARQSTCYAADLEKQLSTEQNQTINRVDNIEALWRILRLSTFEAPPGAVMYLLFDGIERETESNVRALLRLFVGSQAERQQKNDTLKVRAVLTFDTKLRYRLDFSIPEVRMDAVTGKLIQRYTSEELERLGVFQGTDSKSLVRREHIITTVKRFAIQADNSKRTWNFADVNQKLKQIYSAIQRDASSDELKEILDDEPQQRMTPNRKGALDNFTTKLSSKQVSEINLLLPWLLYSDFKFEYWMRVEELEAVLFLARNIDSLQSLTQKMQEPFAKLFQYRSGRVRLNQDVEMILRQGEETSVSASNSDEPRISLDISIRNTQESVVRQFIWKLNEQVSKGLFDFASRTDASTIGLHANKLEGHLTITKLCLKLLNEGWREETESVVWYAREHLPKHFIELHKRIAQISTTDKSIITQGLVSFLRDPYYLVHDEDRHFGEGEYWLADSASKEAVHWWLRKTSSQLQGSDKRWTETVSQYKYGQTEHLREVACSVATKWLNHSKENAKEREKMVGLRRTNSLEQSLFGWLDRFIEHSLGSQDARVNGDYIDTAVIETPSGLIADKTLKETTIDTIDVDTSTAPIRSLEDIHPLQKQLTGGSNPRIDTVQRALHWIERNQLAFDLIGPFCINVGYTYLGLGEYDKARKYFNAALKQDPYRRQAITGLGRVACAQGDKVLGADLLSEAVGEFMNSTNINTLSSGESDDSQIYAELLREVAMIYEELSETHHAIEIYDQSLRCDDDLHTRWNLLRLLCERNSIKYAMSYIKDWSKSTDRYKGKGLAQIIFKLANDDPRCEQLTEWIHGIWDEDLRSEIVCILFDAVQLAAKHPRTLARPGLLFLHGLALARGADPSRRQIAVSLWRDALISSAPEEGPDFGYRYSLYVAAKGVALHEFERFRAELTKQSARGTTQDEEENALIQKHSIDLHVEVFRNPDIPQDRAQTVVNRYITSMHILLGQVEEARQFTASSQMSDALGILGDDDAGNDLAGIRILLALFCSLGDKVGALTAFSLLDRPENTETGRHTQASIQDIDAYSNHNNLTRRCDSCRRIVSSASTDGMWYCQFCADFDLCFSCHKIFVERKLNLHFCDPSHNFVHLYHTEYAAGERAQGKIRIDWEWETREDDKFSRRGGRIVEVSEWLEILRMDWKLPQLDKKTRAQK